MRAMLVRDSSGKVISATVVSANAGVPGQISQVVSDGQRLDEVDIDQLVKAERANASSDHEAIARVMSKLMAGKAK
jgi:hypothetical protein